MSKIEKQLKNQVNLDEFDSFFECITACYGLEGEDVECVTQCVAIHFQDDSSGKVSL